MPSSVAPSALATPEKPASVSGDSSSFHPTMAQPLNSVLASATYLPPPLPYPTATSSFPGNYVGPPNPHLYVQAPAIAKQVFPSAVESNLHHPATNYSKIAQTQHRSVVLNAHAASNNYAAPARGSSPPPLDHLSTSTVGASSDATGIATTPTTAATPAISRPYATTFVEDPNVPISQSAAAESQLAVGTHGSAAVAHGVRASVDDAWTRDQRADGLKGAITTHAMTPVYDVEKLRREGCTVDLKLGQVFNHRGYAICGVLNQHDKPCQRIGRCPFHPFRSPVTQWNSFNSSLTDASSKSRSAEALANSLASMAERRTPRRRVPYKRGWTKEEHFLFLKGLAIHGKGRWKAISAVVTSRTPTQIQSHAQKYFLRQKQRRKNKRSIHDLSLDSPEMVHIHENTNLSAQAEASAARGEEAPFTSQASINPFATVRPTSASLPVGASIHLNTQQANLNSNVGGGEGYANRSVPAQNGSIAQNGGITQNASITHGFQGNVNSGLSAGDQTTSAVGLTATNSNPSQVNAATTAAQPSVYQTRTNPPMISTYSLPQSLNYSLYSIPNPAIGHAYKEDRAISTNMATTTTSMGVGTIGSATNAFVDPAQHVGLPGHGLPSRDL